MSDSSEKDCVSHCLMLVITMKQILEKSGLFTDDYCDPVCLEYFDQVRGLFDHTMDVSRRLDKRPSLTLVDS